MLINSIIIPDMAPNEYRSKIIVIFSFLFLLFFSNIRREEPLLVKSPPINAPSDMALFKYSSVNITLAAQFGISPIRLVINGDNILFVSNILDRYFSPNKVKIVFIIKVIMNINKVICNVCFIADNMML